MLIHLDIRDLLIIDRMELAFQPGLNVLTGETGAGKSILLDALGFVLGWRGRAELVRAGAKQGEVTAVFELAENHPGRDILEEAGLPSGSEVILRRVNTADGRKTAWINDRRASGEVLRRLSDSLVELHGQQDDRGLLNQRTHRALLDAFGGLEAEVATCRATWSAMRRARQALETAETKLSALRAEEAYLRHAIEELDVLAPQPGEDADLDARRRLMQGAERIREDVSRAFEALGVQGAEGLLGDAARWLEGVADRAEGAFDDAIAAIGRAQVELGDAQDGVSRAIEAMTFDPEDLERTEERLFAIRALARKHDVLPDALGTFAEDLRGRLAVLSDGDADLKRLRAALEAAEAEYGAAASRLSAGRSDAAQRLAAAMAQELGPLKMERAQFETAVTPADAGPEGTDAVSFVVSTNPGAPPGPLSRIASGGELSRFLLALKVCLTAQANDLTLIFDEIDRGVGGATADAVGRRLADLAGRAQILVVTHSPQVAARARYHWRVEKTVELDMTTSRVISLDDPARVDEIARMLAGDTVTDEARGAARALLAAS